jgi:hypothetical protein
VGGAGKILALDRAESAWEEMLACEPKPTRGLGDAFDRAPAAIGDYADLISPYLSGHPTGGAELIAWGELPIARPATRS